MIGFFAGAIAGGIIALIMMAIRGQYRENIQNTQVILMDLFTAGSISKVSAKAKERRPRWHRLPYGVPLCIGFVGYLWVAHPLEKPVTPEASAAQSAMQQEGALKRDKTRPEVADALLKSHKTQT
jgi:hypothetical protein